MCFPATAPPVRSVLTARGQPSAWHHMEEESFTREFEILYPKVRGWCKRLKMTLHLWLLPRGHLLYVCPCVTCTVEVVEKKEALFLGWYQQTKAAAAINTDDWFLPFRLKLQCLRSKLLLHNDNYSRAFSFCHVGLQYATTTLSRCGWPWVEIELMKTTKGQLLN